VDCEVHWEEANTLTGSDKIWLPIQRIHWKKLMKWEWYLNLGNCMVTKKAVFSLIKIFFKVEPNLTKSTSI
jgi:hypothetical protein